MDIKIVMESVDYIKSKLNFQPEIGVILGSGLGDMADTVEERTVIKYSEVPNLPVSTVQGHAGQFVVGKLNGKNVIMMQGRFHYYEGYDISTLALPIYIMKNLGVESLIVTNAAGGVNTSFVPGDLMLINDHINFCGNSPLIGKNDDKIGPRFPDMSEAYSKDYIKLAHEVSSDLNLKLQEGVYMMFSGPTYETPSEVRMARILGADAVGMSTVPEVIAARHCGIKTLGISCITNMAAGILDQPLNHNEVIETSTKVKSQFIKLVKEIVARM
ncbi:purine nucleoside phosphorylase I, inosine and guanosine-specific [Clostridium argentinense CDC 2741]|uniref:Purine nucleoside phosphorylase n=1 Tax=Clostridium argentinense CDC 2741 TaxID=1418104 RepID=A0A0C1R3I8_9CLOT|nr:purine-nucleoside phosphorylase [Clostridium argentinense]ARC85206.1 purine-nucleoside phosphorylase [Clostridium argentinense]KIE48097.1 purine nucleoside phosphorylase I, inosine and guanosine-specific [Clostridium argentinense CDC 2741]NFF39491.1 purine-nucleoside phosphorylase [Clostridium argentinense]NFP50962.1 purine-nucleoside phosphorylase [Clostridium argentinense]NFP73644.1 purine-nucleoside phosphorylase [Clostridium argentinense]